jgi:hypothetical protein
MPARDRMCCFPRPESITMGQRQVSDGNAPKRMGFILPSLGESAGCGASLVRAGKVDFRVGNGCARTIASPWAAAPGTGAAGCQSSFVHIVP